MRLPPDVQDFLVAKGYVDDGEWTEKALAGGPADPVAVPVHLELDGEVLGSTVRAAALPKLESGVSNTASTDEPEPDEYVNYKGPGVTAGPELIRLETREPTEAVMAEETKPKTPDITPAQLVTIVGSTLALGAAFGLDIGPEKRDAIITWVTVVGPVLLGADALIRMARSAFVFRKK